MTEIRKLIAIMAVDVVGYSRLLGEDEGGTARAVREHREAAVPLVASRGGRIVKTMGDGLLLEFPSVVAAVECAVAIQKLMVERNADTPEAKRIVYRIGVNLGDVLIEGEDILGEGVNIAARLEAICEPGGVLISSTAYDHVRGKVDLAFLDLGEKALKNIASPVRAYAVKLARQSAQPVAPFASERKGPPRLSLVVLPFANLGGDEEHEYFVDGVTESLTTDLSRLRGAFVIGRNTAYTYKGTPVDLKQIGRELNVRYALEGSVQRGGNRMRVNVQLIDAETGHHLWAERFDKPVADLFDMQDEIVARLAGALQAELISAEARRAERAINPDSMDFYFQGAACLNRGTTPENASQALNFFERALAEDPENVEALVGAGRAYLVMGIFLFVPDPETAFLAAEAKLTQALLAAPDHARAHAFLGSVLNHSLRAPEGIAECEHALTLDRNFAMAHASIGIGKTLVGRSEETEAHITDALRLSPRDKMAFAWMAIAAGAKFNLSRWEDAASWARRSIEANRNFPQNHFALAATLAQLGRYDEARTSLKAGMALDPNYSIARARAFWSRRGSDEESLEWLENILEGLRLVGLPET